MMNYNTIGCHNLNNQADIKNLNEEILDYLCSSCKVDPCLDCDSSQEIEKTKERYILGILLQRLFSIKSTSGDYNTTDNYNAFGIFQSYLNNYYTKSQCFIDDSIYNDYNNKIYYAKQPKTAQLKESILSLYYGLYLYDKLNKTYHTDDVVDDVYHICELRACSIKEYNNILPKLDEIWSSSIFDYIKVHPCPELPDDHCELCETCSTENCFVNVNLNPGVMNLAFEVDQNITGIYDTITLRNKCSEEVVFVSDTILDVADLHMVAKLSSGKIYETIKPNQTFNVDVIITGSPKSAREFDVTYKSGGNLIKAYHITITGNNDGGGDANNTPPVASRIYFELPEGTTYTFKKSDFLNAYSDVDGDDLVAIEIHEDSLDRFIYKGQTYQEGTVIPLDDVVYLSVKTPSNIDSEDIYKVKWYAIDARGKKSLMD